MIMIYYTRKIAWGVICNIDKCLSVVLKNEGDLELNRYFLNGTRNLSSFILI